MTGGREGFKWVSICICAPSFPSLFVTRSLSYFLSRCLFRVLRSLPTFPCPPLTLGASGLQHRKSRQMISGFFPESLDTNALFENKTDDCKRSQHQRREREREACLRMIENKTSMPQKTPHAKTPPPPSIDSPVPKSQDIESKPQAPGSLPKRHQCEI